MVDYLTKETHRSNNTPGRIPINANNKGSQNEHHYGFTSSASQRARLQ